MKAQFLRLLARFDGLKQTERVLVATILLAAIILLPYLFMIEPSMAKIRQAESQIKELNASLQEVQMRLTALDDPSQHPDVLAEAELKILRAQVAEREHELAEFKDRLVPPKQMRHMLESVLLGRRSALRVVALKTLPAEPLVEPPAQAQQDPKAPPSAPLPSSAGFFKHGIELELEGSYAEILAYLERLEKADSKVLWSKSTLTASYPKLRLKLTVYTLSLERVWLTI